MKRKTTQLITDGTWGATILCRFFPCKWNGRKNGYQHSFYWHHSRYLPRRPAPNKVSRVLVLPQPASPWWLLSFFRSKDILLAINIGPVHNSNKNIRTDKQFIVGALPPNKLWFQPTWDQKKVSKHFPPDKIHI